MKKLLIMVVCLLPLRSLSQQEMIVLKSTSEIVVAAPVGWPWKVWETNGVLCAIKNAKDDTLPTNAVTVYPYAVWTNIVTGTATNRRMLKMSRYYIDVTVKDDEKPLVKNSAAFSTNKAGFAASP